MLNGDYRSPFTIPKNNSHNENHAHVERSLYISLIFWVNPESWKYFIPPSLRVGREYCTMRVWVETLQLTFCLFSFPHKGYSYALKQSVIAKGNDCSNVSGFRWVQHESIQPLNIFLVDIRVLLHTLLMGEIRCLLMLFK